MPDLRLFVAVPLDPRVRDSLKRWTLDLRKDWPFQKWVHPDDLHITLKFLGSTSSQRKDQLIDLLQGAASELHGFRLEIGALGAFGKPSMPSVLQAGLRGELETLRALQKRVEQAAAGLGFEPESRAYQPHVTLARRYQGQEPFQRRWTEEASLPADSTWSWDVSSFTLYQSHLSRSPMYEALHTFPLQTSSQPSVL
jgi:RNA 2',3'-cyclic 3'-phosphodiesterase